MRFNTFTEYLERLEATTKRLEMYDILSELFNGANKDEVKNIIYFCEEQLLPPFYTLEMNMAGSIAARAIAEVSGKKKEDLDKQYKKIGDYGLVAEEAINKSIKKELTINEVYDRLTYMAKVSGNGSVEKKISLLAELLKHCKKKEAKYVIRFVLGRLRLGIGDPTIMDSMSKAITGNRSELRKDIERAYNLCSDLGLVGETLFKKGIEAVKKFQVNVGSPIRMAAAERLPGPKEIIGKIGKCAVESKYDGFRCISGYTSVYIKERGILPVKNVKVGDYALTHNGEFKKVIAKNKRTIDKTEKVFKFQTYLGNEFKITEKHKVLCHIQGKTKWLAVEKLSEDNEVVFPIPKIKSSKPPSNLKLQTISNYKKSFKLNKDFYRFLGYWVGDGYSNEYNCSNRIGLLFNAKTGKKTCETYKKIVIKELNVNKISQSIHNGAIQLYWEDKPFLQWLSHNFRQKWKEGWKGKTLPEWFFSVSKENFKEFLKGWIESDGHTDKLGRTAITTKEASLAATAQLIALKFGIIIGIKKLRIKGSTYYKLIITKNKRKARIIKNKVFVKILRKKELSRNYPREVDPRQKVYNLQVAGDESYCTTMCALHNCQIHKKGGKVEIFSRNLEKMTHMFPDIVAGIKKQINAKTAIFEGEALALNESSGELLPFQITIQRKRKHQVLEMSKDLPLVMFLFDILYKDDKELTNLGYEERHKIMLETRKEGSTIKIANRIITDNPKEMEKFFKGEIAKGLEGIIAKRLNGIYEAGGRGFNWIKMKRSYKGELQDTIDIVPIGYFKGRGMRTKFGIGAILGAVYDKKKDMFTSIARIGSGLTEENWVKIRKELDKDKIAKRSARVHSAVVPDVWVTPKHVLTVMADEITQSQMHMTAKDGDGPGLALRFPRIQGWIRQDKRPEDATSVKEVQDMFKLQRKVKALSFGK